MQAIMNVEASGEMAIIFPRRRLCKTVESSDWKKTSSRLATRCQFFFVACFSRSRNRPLFVLLFLLVPYQLNFVHEWRELLNDIRHSSLFIQMYSTASFSIFRATTKQSQCYFVMKWIRTLPMLNRLDLEHLLSILFVWFSYRRRNVWPIRRQAPWLQFGCDTCHKFAAGLASYQQNVTRKMHVI